jgi:hypothetical protein
LLDYAFVHSRFQNLLDPAPLELAGL